jgi:subtilisin family serine protease
MLALLLTVYAAAVGAAEPGEAAEAACPQYRCSTLIPSARVESTASNDCLYRNGSSWWLDYVAGSLLWSPAAELRKLKPVTVAIFDDGADVTHPELAGQLVPGWDFVNDRAEVAAGSGCALRNQHGTFMASLIAARRNNRIGIAAPGSDGARVMVLRVVGCESSSAPGEDLQRVAAALRYARAHGARILSFSAEWRESSPEVDALLRELADDPGPQAAIVVAGVPNRGETELAYPARYPFRRIVRAVPIGDDDSISPGTSPVPDGLNLGAPSACVVGAVTQPSGEPGYAIASGSSNSAAILAGLLAGLWARPTYAKFSADEFLDRVVRQGMLRTRRHSRPGARAPYLDGVPLADACVIATLRRTTTVCRDAGKMRARGDAER